LSGSASAESPADATANGAVLVAATFLVGGVAVGDVPITITTGSGFVPGERRDGIAYGRLLVANAELLPGRAIGISLLSGRAAGAAYAANGNIVSKAAIVKGIAVGEVNLSDEQMLFLLAAA